MIISLCVMYMWVQVPESSGEKKYLNPWSWSVRWLWAYRGPYERTHRPISLAPTPSNLSSRMHSYSFLQDHVKCPFQFSKQCLALNVSSILLLPLIFSPSPSHSLTSRNSIPSATLSWSTIHKATFIQLHCTSKMVPLQTSYWILHTVYLSLYLSTQV